MQIWLGRVHTRSWIKDRIYRCKSYLLEQPLLDTPNINHGEEVSCGLLKACCDASEVFNSVEEDLHKVPLLVKVPVVIHRVLPGRVRANNSIHTFRGDLVANPLAVVGGISKKRLALSRFDEFLGNAGFMTLARSKDDMQRLAQCVYESMDLR